MASCVFTDALTSVDGSYAIRDIQPGNYYIEEYDLDGYMSTTSNILPNKAEDTIQGYTFKNGDALFERNFGDWNPNTLIGKVFDSRTALLTGNDIEANIQKAT